MRIHREIDAQPEGLRVEPARGANRRERIRDGRTLAILAIPRVAQVLDHRLPGIHALMRIDRRAGEHAAALHRAERPRRPGQAAPRIGLSRHHLRVAGLVRQFDQAAQQAILGTDLRDRMDLAEVPGVKLGGPGAGARHQFA
jgi:hypothetical protein